MPLNNPVAIPRGDIIGRIQAAQTTTFSIDQYTQIADNEFSAHLPRVQQAGQMWMAAGTDVDGGITNLNNMANRVAEVWTDEDFHNNWMTPVNGYARQLGEVRDRFQQGAQIQALTDLERYIRSTQTTIAALKAEADEKKAYLASLNLDYLRSIQYMEGSAIGLMMIDGYIDRLGEIDTQGKTAMDALDQSYRVAAGFVKEAGATPPLEGPMADQPPTDGATTGTGAGPGGTGAGSPTGGLGGVAAPGGGGGAAGGGDPAGGLGGVPAPGGGTGGAAGGGDPAGGLGGVPAPGGGTGGAAGGGDPAGGLGKAASPGLNVPALPNGQGGGDPAGGLGQVAGPGLAGSPGTGTAPQLNVPNLPNTGGPGGTSGIGGIGGMGSPLNPFTHGLSPALDANGRPIGPAGLGGLGSGRDGGAGGIGGGRADGGLGKIDGPGKGGGIGGIGGGPGQVGALQDASGNTQQIPQAARNLTAQTGGQIGAAPQLTGGGGGPSGTATGAPVGGVPPMMPPMMPGGGGGGGSGKPRPGTAPPVAPGRMRPAGANAGVPAGLLGRAAANDPAARARRGDRGGWVRREAPETEELLDEELWRVEEPEPAQPAPPPAYRPSV